MMKTIYIDYDNSKLKNISEKIYDLFINNNYKAFLLNNDITSNEKINIINKTPNSFIISNKINNDNGIEIIYPLRDNSNLALLLNDNLSKITTVTKYYQLRDNINTNLDYYQLLQNINNSDGVVIKYNLDLLNNEKIEEDPLIYEIIG